MKQIIDISSAKEFVDRARKHGQKIRTSRSSTTVVSTAGGRHKEQPAIRFVFQFDPPDDPERTWRVVEVHLVDAAGALEKNPDSVLAMTEGNDEQIVTHRSGSI